MKIAIAITDDLIVICQQSFDDGLPHLGVVIRQGMFADEIATKCIRSD